MPEIIRKIPAARSAIAHYEQLSNRDRRALQIMLVALALAILYLGIWRPIVEFRGEGYERMQQARERVAWVSAREQDLKRIAQKGESGQGASLGDADLLKTVTESADRSGLPLQRFEPSGDDAMRLWLEAVPFTDLTQWLAHLQSKYGLAVDQASLDRTKKPGLVDARLTLAP
ncbi:type II secretion system protein M [Salicola sp. Rm-C-2C1-2]|uniref:type II secretion system protein M n=1 Tax=Salicola sp. Rm-C-2C1-2 TaxID=3141321 RepID=UPI0032E4B6CC